ncbi:ABC transporter substrate-binding protein [Fictibacillus terranigra]|uniref:ABC transporter substrate-binding protein n=1 Tax=Fictibacillus terranigra TaxID=3058424 RepID=A0ABT8EBT3_9BACL|nr:ABC transporter substrate-binding protein [Fictibacillus sp. CENA-BCM004]MDN4075390.1 ABC transporter substrate-binding protein [Fictibacillus sp. CENA-BCM004]
MRKLQVAGLILFLIGGLLSGCSWQQASATKGDENNIKLWVPFSGPDGPKFEEIVRAYNQSQEKYKVDLQIIPSSEYYKMVNLTLSSKNNLPDLMIMHADRIVDYATKDQLLQTEVLTKSKKINAADYHPKALQASKVNGSTYGIPLDIHPLMFYWNKDLFKKAGLDPNSPPQNEKEFKEYAKKLTAPEKNQYGFAVPTVGTQPFLFQTILAQKGGKLYNDGHFNYTSKEALSTLKFVRDLIYKDKVSPSGLAIDGDLKLFLQGKNAMHFNGPWMLAQFEGSGLNFGVAPVPQIGEKVQKVWANSHNFVVPKKKEGEKLPAIADFLNYVGDHGMAWAESGQAPASKAVYTSKPFKELNQQPKVAESFDFAEYPPQVENWGQVSDFLFQEVNLVLLGKKNPKKALEDAQKKAEQYLD